MQLPQSRELAAELIWRDEVASTNDALRELVAEHPELPSRTVLVTDNQTAGRGRLGREWVAPAGGALAISVLLREPAASRAPTWLPLLAGSAVRRALSPFISEEHRLGVKWPNDVLAFDEAHVGLKLSGILSEMLADGSIIIGIGINTALSAAELPAETATSLALLREGEPPEPDDILAAVLRQLFTLLDSLAEGEMDALRELVASDSSTLGTHVRAHLPNGVIIEGEALRLSDDGALVIAGDADGAEVLVAAGDIEHLR